MSHSTDMVMLGCLLLTGAWEKRVFVHLIDCLLPVNSEDPNMNIPVDWDVKQ